WDATSLISALVMLHLCSGSVQTLSGVDIAASSNLFATNRVFTQLLPRLSELNLYPRQIMPRQSELRFERFQFFTGEKPTKPRASAIDVKETVICAGVQENGKLPTKNEPKIGLSLQNVRTVKVEGLPGLFRYRFTKQQSTPYKVVLLQCTMVVFFPILEQHNGNSYDYRRGRKVIHCQRM
ncbi:hypothetical protein IGI04_033926, partial [Brassica rapa subsp. trilocularis]